MGRLYKSGEIAKMIGISDSTLRKWVMERRIPFYKIGSAVRFSIPEIEEWLQNEYKGKKGKSKIQLNKVEVCDDDTKESQSTEEKTLSPEIYEAAIWVENQIRTNKYCDCGFTVSVHDEEIRRTDYSLTVKHRSMQN